MSLAYDAFYYGIMVWPEPLCSKEYSIQSARCDLNIPRWRRCPQRERNQTLPISTQHIVMSNVYGTLGSPVTVDPVVCSIPLGDGDSIEPEVEETGSLIYIYIHDQLPSF